MNRTDIQKIIDSAQLAPTGKVFVIAPDAKNRARLILELQKAIKHKIRIQKVFGIFNSKQKTFHISDLSMLDKNTYWILVAEMKTFNGAEKQSVAQGLQSIKQAAASKGYIFQPLPESELLNKSTKAREILGIYLDQYEIDGCVIGNA